LGFHRQLTESQPQANTGFPATEALNHLRKFLKDVRVNQSLLVPLVPSLSSSPTGQAGSAIAGELSYETRTDLQEKQVTPVNQQYLLAARRPGNPGRPHQSHLSWRRIEPPGIAAVAIHQEKIIPVAIRLLRVTGQAIRNKAV